MEEHRRECAVADGFPVRVHGMGRPHAVRRLEARQERRRAERGEGTTASRSARSARATRRFRDVASNHENPRTASLPSM
jgi:hypothetical protein